MLTHPTHIIGLVIVDHGSRRQAANDMLLEVVAMFKRVANAGIVEPAHMEIAEPTIAQAFDECVAQGATLVIVHPYFLSPGRHSTTDIPTLTAAAAARHPNIPFHVTEPLGLDEKIVQVIQQRISECLKSDLHCAGSSATGSVIPFTGGPTEPRA